MQLTFYIFLYSICITFFNSAEAQKKNVRTTTIILLRHAEKDTSVGRNNPPLSAEGIARAKRLSALFPNIVPDEFYSTPYIRTMETLRPWAEATGKQIKPYPAGSAMEFAEELLKEKGKIIVVAGHLNTIPPLVNLLIGSDKYQMLPELEYGTIYVVTVKNGNAKERVIHY